ncbi:MAG: hypothetical protein ACQEWV_00290 [Bacillota bacterium]
MSKVQLTRIGIIIHAWEENVDMKNETSYDYLSHGGTFDHRENEYVLTIY